MRVVFFVFIVLSIPFNGISQSLPSEESIYDFTRLFLSGSDSLTLRLRQDAANSNLYADSSAFLSDTSYFSQVDFDCFRSQIQSNHKFKWEENRFTNVKTLSESKLKWIFRSHEKGWVRFHRKYNNACLISCSIPIFSADKTYCIFYCAVSCDGLLGRGSTNIYKLENGKWVYVDSYGMWVS